MHPPNLSHIHRKQPVKKREPRDTKCRQTRSALWEPLHDWTKPDDSLDDFSLMAGGEAGVLATAGYNRIK